jgi:hypothetical protein
MPAYFNFILKGGPKKIEKKFGSPENIFNFTVPISNKVKSQTSIRLDFYA